MLFKSPSEFKLFSLTPCCRQWNAKVFSLGLRHAMKHATPTHVWILFCYHFTFKRQSTGAVTNERPKVLITFTCAITNIGQMSIPAPTLTSKVFCLLTKPRNSVSDVVYSIQLYVIKCISDLRTEGTPGIDIAQGLAFPMWAVTLSKRGVGQLIWENSKTYDFLDRT